MLFVVGKASTKSSIDGQLETTSNATKNHSLTICNGESKLIACLPEEGIQIQDAFYGKQIGEDCHGKLPYKDDSPTCSALDARANVEESCNKKQSCLLTADENVYGKSLCPHVNKYLRFEYACVPLPMDSDEKKDEVTKHAEDKNTTTSKETAESVETPLVKEANSEEEAVSRTLQELGK